MVSDNELDELLKSAIQQVILARLCKDNCAVVCTCALNLLVCIGYYLGWTYFWMKDAEGSYWCKRRAICGFREKGWPVPSARCTGIWPKKKKQYSSTDESSDVQRHKLHIDQNEKLAMYGVTHVCTIDGYSKYIPACHTLSVKNNLIIYKEIYRFIYLLLNFWVSTCKAKKPPPLVSLGHFERIWRLFTILFYNFFKTVLIFLDI